ncbi:GstD1, partial [Cordylochernes scorpioides]
MTIDLYQVPVSAPCRAVMMTAREIGVDLNLKFINLLEGEQKKPEFVKMNPQHCLPTIDDNGFVLWESRAIQTYLVNKYSPGNDLYPSDPQARALVDRLLYFDIGVLYKSLGELVYPQLFQGQPKCAEKEEAFYKALCILNKYLAKTPYVAGENRTIADLSIFAGLTFGET